MIDMAIIGAGTAGLTAAIYGRRAGYSCTVFEKAVYGGQIVNTPDIANYPGIAHVSGADFAQNLYEQASALGADIQFETVSQVTETQKDGKPVFTLITPSGSYEARSVILATGAKNRRLGVEGEEQLTGHGVSYCATCDGMFFQGKDVAVVGGGNTAVADALYLSHICRKVYLIHRRDTLRAVKADADALKAAGNVEFVLNANVTKLISDGTVLKGIETTDKNTGEVREIAVSALFVAVGQEPDNQRFADLVSLENGYIKAGEDCITSCPGIFAAGDCRTKQLRQLTTAAADGAMAATQAAAYLR